MYYLISRTLRGYAAFHLDAWNVFVFFFFTAGWSRRTLHCTLGSSSKGHYGMLFFLVLDWNVSF